MPIHLSGAQYAQKLLNDPDWYMPVLIEHVANVIAAISPACMGLQILTSVDIEGPPAFKCSELADVLIELNERPETVCHFIERFKKDQLIYRVRHEESAILVTTSTRNYGTAHISRHQRLDCVRVQIV